MPIDVTRGDEEIRHLRSSINDLINIQALPTIWDGRESGSIVSTLLDVLVSMLQLDFAYLRLSNSINQSPVDFVQLAQRPAPPPQAAQIGRALDRWLTSQSVNAPLVAPNPAGEGEVKIALCRLGLADEIGALVAASKRANFPTPTETLLLRTAANQALVALQEARQLQEQQRAAQELERRVADRTAQLTAANEALRESEEKYRTLFDSIDEGFCTIEVLFGENDKPVDYRFLEVNPSFEKQTGIQNAQGRRMREIAPQHEEHWFETYGRIALTGEPARFENQAAQLHRWYDLYAFRVGEPAHRKVAILFKDISERKQAEAKLLRNEAYLSEAQRLSHTGSFGWRPAIGELLWSEETFRIFQYEQTLKPTVELVLQRVHPDDATLVKETIGRASQDGKDFDFEHRLRMPDGSVKHVRVVAHAERAGSGEVEFVGAVMDVTLAKQAEDKIRLIINTVPGLLWTARPDGWVDFLSQRWLDYTGMTLQQGLGWAWQPGYHPDDLGNVLSKWRTAVAERKPLEVEARLRRFDGEYRWFLKRAFPLLDRAGRVLGWYGGNIDVHDLKQAEEKLRRIETYFSEGQRLSHTGSWAWSVKTKENLFWSREHYRIYGFDPDTDSGHYAVARERIHPADVSAFDENLKRMMQQPIDFEIHYRIVLPDGEIRHIHALGHPVLNNAGELVEYIGTTMDVTERKRAEEALRRSESYLAEAQRLSHTGSWARVCATGEIRYWSEEYTRVMGFEPRDGQPRLETFLQRVHPQDRAKVRETVAGPGKVDYELDYRIVLPGGDIRHIHTVGHPVFSPSGELVEFVGTVMDVTERKLSESLLSSEKHLLEMIAGGAPLPAVLNDLCSAIDEQSPGLISTVLSLDGDGQRLWPAAGPGVPQGWTRLLSPLVIGPCAGSCGTAAYRKEMVVVSDVATDPLWADFRDSALSYGLKACWSKPIISTTGSVLGTFATYYGEIRSPGKRELLLIERATHIAHIAIERDRTQDSLRKAQANLAHATRVSTMGELTASIAHEVNQPLAAVVNNANACISLLPDGDPNLEEVREALAEIIDDAERASDVIARVRQLARNAPVERKPLDLRDVIADVMALARHESATRRVTIHTEIPKEPPLVLGDRVQLQQVLLNLVVNGMDAMNAVEESKRVLMICGHCETRDGRLESLVSVQDAGTGFKPEQVNRLFEAFYTTKPQGMGMGLAISRSIIEAHGGRLWAEPSQGPGATFLFSLPAAPQPLGKGGPAAGDAAS